ncbi:MAG: hypothetical protein K6C34_00930 [Alphaproteobacteria bacterium]|nr:hypothetical protein [Alphaproteobacteria bacterium]
MIERIAKINGLSRENKPIIEFGERLIRCKDCKYFKRRSIYHHGLCDVHCNGIGEEEVTSEDQYCSWAERKEEG